ncbi:MAG: hypothetical protein HAW59_07110, partial [Betaproteobacteria bacterium]|nr:hypothetical protein [Betaproteobacteria bacterium]
REAVRKLYIGDNLAVMRGLESGMADLIYLDPPFNSKSIYKGAMGSKAEKQQFKDVWKLTDINEDEFDRLEVNNPAVYELVETLYNVRGKEDSWKAYLTFMAVRLDEMRRILKDTGSIYLHCDSTMSHPLKLLMDVIFGKDNFRNEIIWKKTNSPKTQSTVFGEQHDTIMFYSKSKKITFNKVFSAPDAKYLKSYRFSDERGQYQTVALVAGGAQRTPDRKTFEFRGVVAPWLHKKENLETWWADNLIVKTPSGYRKKHYLSDSKGKIVSDIWIDNDVNPIQGNANEKTGWSTQKPNALLRRIIKASSDAGDLVLDPFCGCATACVVAENLGCSWVGIDIDPECETIMKERCAGESSEMGRKKVEDRSILQWKNVEVINARKAANLPRRKDIKEINKNDPAIKASFFRRQDGKCGLCKKPTRITLLEYDRVIPGIRGGRYTPDNIELLCSQCNKIKGGKTRQAAKRKVVQNLVKEQLDRE